MSDIVERLRDRAASYDDRAGALELEAAAEIELLRAALDKIARGTWNIGVYSSEPCDARQFARRALEPKP